MSFKKRVGFVFFSFAVLCITRSFEISAQQVTLNDEWVLTNSYGFPVSIAFNDLIHAPVGDRREIFLFVEARHFTPENIKQLFISLAAEYKQPDWLSVTAFSDKLMLQRAIDTSRSGVHIHWADTPEGTAAAKKWAEDHYPLPSGYDRAHYFRIRRFYYSQSYIEESYSYSPDPAKTATVNVQLQRKPVDFPYTGNVDSDLLIAAYEGDAARVRSLIDRGANVNAKQDDGDTPLMLASLSGKDLAIVKLLLSKGADVNARDKENDTALIYAAAKEPDILHALLDKGAHINHQNDNGYSALIMAAAVEYRLAPLKALLTRGADVEAKDKHGNTALMLAARNGAIEMIRALTQKNANVTATGEGDETPLIKAAATGKTELVKLLLEKGSNVNARNQDGVTALMAARSKETALALLSSGADVNAKDKEGATPLMYAATWGAIDSAQALIERGADVKAKNKKGETALSLANKLYGTNNALLDLLESAEAKHDSTRPGEKESAGIGGTSDQPHLVVTRDPKSQCCEEVSSVAFNRDGKLLASKLYHSAFAGNHGILFWNASSGKLIKSIDGPPNGAIRIAFSPDGKEISSQYGKIWDVESGRSVPKFDTSDAAQSDTAVYSAAFNLDGRVAVKSGRKLGERNNITIRDARTGGLIRSFATDSEVTELRLGADGNLFGVFRASDTIAIWDVDTGEVKQKIKIVGPAFFDMALSNDGKLLAVSAGEITTDLPVFVLDTGTGKHVFSLDEDSSVVFSLAFSPDGKHLATGSGNAKVKLYDAASGKLLRTMEGHTQLVRSVAFSPDGRLLASGGGKNETKLWSVATGRLLVTLQAFNDGNWIAYTPDGYYDRSEGASKYITWRPVAERVDVGKYDVQFFKPEIIAGRLRD